MQALYNLLNIRPEEISDRYKNLDIAPIIYEDSLKNAPDDIAVIIKNCSYCDYLRLNRPPLVGIQLICQTLMEYWNQ